jgi:hypothetical protein
MLLVDDILAFPVRSLLWVFREIHNAAQEELANEGESLTARLSELYMMLETGQITEEAFDSEEKKLLDRLDRLQDTGQSEAADEEEDEDAR